jgi:hypothetical protein
MSAGVWERPSMRGVTVTPLSLVSPWVVCDRATAIVRRPRQDGQTTVPRAAGYASAPTRVEETAYPKQTDTRNPLAPTACWLGTGRPGTVGR